VCPWSLLHFLVRLGGDLGALTLCLVCLYYRKRVAIEVVVWTTRRLGMGGLPRRANCRRMLVLLNTIPINSRHEHSSSSSTLGSLPFRKEQRLRKSMNGTRRHLLVRIRHRRPQEALRRPPVSGHLRVEIRDRGPSFPSTWNNRLHRQWHRKVQHYREQQHRILGLFNTGFQTKT